MEFEIVYYLLKKGGTILLSYIYLDIPGLGALVVLSSVDNNFFILDSRVRYSITI